MRFLWRRRPDNRWGEWRRRMESDPLGLCAQVNAYYGTSFSIFDLVRMVRSDKTGISLYDA